MKNKIVFLGTPKFAKIILEKLILSRHKPVLVITSPDKPVGRKQKLTPPPVKVLAERKKIPVLQPEKLDEEFINKLRDNSYDLFVTAAYGKLLPKKLLDIPRHGTLNVHPSLLPKWRGSSPVQYSILNGDKETGSTIMLLDEKLDHGPILAQERLEIKKSNTAPILSDKLAKHGAELLTRTIPKWLNGKIEPKEQDHGAASYTKMLTRSDGKIDWTMPAGSLERKLMALTPWPGLFTFWNDKRLKILSFDVKNKRSSQPGKVIRENRSLAVETGRGIILIKKIQLEGEKPKSSAEFMRGHPDIIGTLLGT
ncbi:MAG: methionyl-tRNA formyltransferase [Candidatus Spechtbacteria bacterium RIFCSPLOWO2_01_FULL_43_12]|uniref:Methionyl-tRNA formyltransferase n=1 Tax=Candidatus Spechtbacteria bacterium RIFCSPLOWO2_01_FULL_43_12 TaxID=1802162 RepID=A0A1G2HFX9_9BACT|nr:MAG: methionyl-tRNA formyltransferase [Candidatus Spechtbacteria bacterium RIFCSPLOWO2_01_FULL_43_12]